MSSCSPDALRQLTDRVINVHAKFNNMTEIPGRPGEHEDIAIDYPAAIGALADGGYHGYLNSEYEGQRYFQDLPREQLMDEVDQVRRHQEMLRRLTAA